MKVYILGLDLECKIDIEVTQRPLGLNPCHVTQISSKIFVVVVEIR